MQWCNAHTSIATRIFNWTASHSLASIFTISHQRSLSLTPASHHSLLFLILTLCFHSYKYNFNLRSPCWSSPIYFDSMEYNMIFVNRTNALRIRCSKVKAQFNNNNNEFFWLNKSISKYYAFDAWIHIHLLRVFGKM